MAAGGRAERGVPGVRGAGAGRGRGRPHDRRRDGHRLPGAGAAPHRGAERLRARDRLDDRPSWWSLAIALGVPDDIFGELVHFGLVAGELFAGLLAIYIARLRTRARMAQYRAEVQYAVASTLQQHSALADAAPRLLREIGEPLGLRGRRPLGGRARPLAAMRGDLAGTGRARRGVRVAHAEPRARARAWACRDGCSPPARRSGSRTSPSTGSCPRADAAAEVGLRSAVAFPLRTSGGIVGVVELFSEQSRQADGAVLDLLGAVGGQIAEFLEASRSASALRESEARKARDARGGPRRGRDDRPPRAASWSSTRPPSRRFGYSREEAVGREMAELIVPPDLRAAHRTALQRCVDTGEGAPARPAGGAARHEARRLGVPDRAHDHPHRRRRPADVHRLHPRHHRPQGLRGGTRATARARARRAPGRRPVARPARRDPERRRRRGHRAGARRTAAVRERVGRARRWASSPSRSCWRRRSRRSASGSSRSTRRGARSRSSACRAGSRCRRDAARRT